MMVGSPPPWCPTLLAAGDASVSREHWTRLVASLGSTAGCDGGTAAPKSRPEPVDRATPQLTGTTPGDSVSRRWLMLGVGRVGRGERDVFCAGNASRCSSSCPPGHELDSGRLRSDAVQSTPRSCRLKRDAVQSPPRSLFTSTSHLRLHCVQIPRPATAECISPPFEAQAPHFYSVRRTGYDSQPLDREARCVVIRPATLIYITPLGWVALTWHRTLVRRMRQLRGSVFCPVESGNRLSPRRPEHGSVVTEPPSRGVVLQGSEHMADQGWTGSKSPGGLVQDATSFFARLSRLVAADYLGLEYRRGEM
ncbi:hypothetical protein JHW43_001010 [Diplocarpon mali]|nr:hypothetical protein JHW43_001010 [Diplocarpon mali]